jgi:hypothetical protein
VYGEFRVLSPAVGRGQTGGRGWARFGDGGSESESAVRAAALCSDVEWSWIARLGRNSVSVDVQFRSIVYTTNCERRRFVRK